MLVAFVGCVWNNINAKNSWFFVFKIEWFWNTTMVISKIILIIIKIKTTITKIKRLTIIKSRAIQIENFFLCANHYYYSIILFILFVFFFLHAAAIDFFIVYLFVVVVVFFFVIILFYYRCFIFILYLYTNKYDESSN